MTRRTAFTPINWAKRVPTMLRTDQRPDTTAHAVLAALATYANQDGTEARPSIGTLAADTRFSAEYVAEALERCQAAGLISKMADLTGGTAVWRLHMDVVDEGPTVHDQRQARRRAVDAERQRRARQRKAEEATRHGAGHRDVTVPESVTVTVPHTVTVTASETVTSRSEQRDCHGGDAVSHGPTTVTTAGQTGYIPHDLPKEVKKTSSSSRRGSKTEPELRPDVEQLCERLRDGVIANGSKTPKITQTWRDEARRMLDIDGRELDKALALIDWTMNDTFWRANVESMPTFRKKYDQLRLKALGEWERGQQRQPQPNGRPVTGSKRVDKALSALAPDDPFLAEYAAAAQQQVTAPHDFLVIEGGRTA